MQLLVDRSRGRNQWVWCWRWVFGTELLCFGCLLNICTFDFPFSCHISNWLVMVWTDEYDIFIVNLSFSTSRFFRKTCSCKPTRHPLKKKQDQDFENIWVEKTSFWKLKCILCKNKHVLQTSMKKWQELKAWDWWKRKSCSLTD